jgi:transposase
MGVPTMGQVRTWAALDVHENKLVAAAVDTESGYLQIKLFQGQTRRVVGFCTTLPAPVRVAYEAGPTGFGFARELETVESSAWWQRPARSSALRRIG